MELRILQQNEDKTNQLFESADCQSLLSMYEEYYPLTGFTIPWVAYFIIRQNQVLGSCGFTGKPRDGRVEIAYWTFKEFEGQGIASFACKELIKITQNTDPTLNITAKTEMKFNASVKILKNHHFTFNKIVQDEEIGDACLWVLKPDESTYPTINKLFQPTLHQQFLALQPLQEADFEPLFAVASDPAIWEQHPYRNRWQREAFSTFFNTSINSNGAFKIVDLKTNKLIGATRFYEYNEQESSIAIGGTFISRAYWGTDTNKSVKKLLLDYIFDYVTTVYFYIDQQNKRSQIAIERLGAKKHGEKPISETMTDDIYQIKKEDWLNGNR